MVTEHHLRMIDAACAAETRADRYASVHREIIAELRYARGLQRQLDESMRRVTELALRATTKGKE